jgi:hypothetical protein
LRNGLLWQDVCAALPEAKKSLSPDGGGEA